jgi:hypothetical protein
VRQFLLAAVLVGGAVALFFGGRAVLAPDLDLAASASLGDLQPMQAIVTDVQGIVGSGDLGAAKTRITDLETAWDVAEPVMRPKDPAAWGKVDDAIDAALAALRKGNPDAGEAGPVLQALQVAMADPSGWAATGGLVLVDGIAVTDETGHPLPCEDLLSQVRDARGAATVTDPAALDDLVAKATERCNADDDRNADGFSAAALKLLGQG